MRIRIPHLGTKIAAVVLALLIWLLVSGEQTVERVLSVPLVFIDFPATLELIGEAPPVVDVRVRGSSSAIAGLTEGELAALLDVASARPGQRLFHLTESDVRAPFGIEVIQVTPSSIELTFEEQMQRLVPVAPRLEGTPAAGFVVTESTPEPAMVTVLGPRRALERVFEATTEPVSVDGASETFTDTVNVGVSEPSVRLPQARTVAVTVTIVPAEGW